MDPARRRSRVQAALAEIQGNLLRFFEQCVRDAQELRQLPPGLEPRRIAFAVDATLIGADLNYLVFGDAGYLELARDEVRRLLAVTPVDAGPRAVDIPQQPRA